MTLTQLNTKIKKINPYVELVKGHGYFYFVFDHGILFETESVYVPHFNVFTPAEWLEKATQFAAKLTALELETAERLKI